MVILPFFVLWYIVVCILCPVLMMCCTIGGVMYTSADYILVYCLTGVAILNEHQLFRVVIYIVKTIG